LRKYCRLAFAADGILDKPPSNNPIKIKLYVN